MSDDSYLFLTNGIQFIGPYLAGDAALIRGKRILAEADGGPYEVHAVRAATLEGAKQVWAQDEEKHRALRAARRP